MLVKIVFAGFGGQGVLLMGYLFSYVAMKENKFVTFLPSYGAEVRGGTAKCTVSISDEEIASPVASSPDIVVVLNNPSFLKFQPTVKPGGEIFLNSTLVKENVKRKDILIYKIPATEIAKNLGNIKTTNMVMLGAFLKKKNFVSLENLINSVEEILSSQSPKIIEINKKAIREGFEYFKN
jgi:2-oxoglutarate ferredoxin oxidoreductase subunit gamma